MPAAEASGRHHNGGERVLGRNLVLQNVGGGAGAQGFGQHGRGVLVEAAHGVEAAFLVAQLQRSRLLATPNFVGRQAAFLGGQVQHRKLHGRGPLLAVVLPEQELVEAAPVGVGRVDGHRHGGVARSWGVEALACRPAPLPPRSAGRTWACGTRRRPVSPVPSGTKYSTHTSPLS